MCCCGVVESVVLGVIVRRCVPLRWRKVSDRGRMISGEEPSMWRAPGRSKKERDAQLERLLLHERHTAPFEFFVS